MFIMFSSSFTKYLQIFIKLPFSVYYGSWFDHVTSWETAMETKNVHILHIKYEDMKKVIILVYRLSFISDVRTRLFKTWLA